MQANPEQGHAATGRDTTDLTAASDLGLSLRVLLALVDVGTVPDLRER